MFIQLTNCQEGISQWSNLPPPLRIVNKHFSALSLLLCLNWPGDIVITINNSAMIIIFNAL